MTMYPAVFHFRLTQDVADDLKKVANAAGLKRSTWARRQLLHAIDSAMIEPAVRRRVMNAEAIRELVVELKREGNNLNRFTMDRHMRAPIDEAKFEETLDHLNRLYAAIAVAMGLDIHP
jgi:hypothetical protein